MRVTNTVFPSRPVIVPNTAGGAYQMGDGFNDDCAVVGQIGYLGDPATIDNLPRNS